MKKKILLIPICLSPLVLSSCSFSDLIDINPVKSVEITDDTRYYAYGDVYKNENQLNIVVTNKNGKIIEPQQSEITINLMVDGVEQDYNSSFENRGGAGKLTISVTYNKVESNTLTYDLLNEHIYIQDMSFSGVYSANTFEEVSLNLTINPTNYTTRLKIYASDPNMASVSYDGSVVKVTGKKPGTTTITALASRGAGNPEVFAHHNITFIASTKMYSAGQTYNDYVKNNIYNVSACPLEGSPNLLVIPVWFTDSNRFITSDAKKANVKEDIQKIYFGSTSETGWHSVSSYYKEESKGKLNLQGVVSDWYESGISYRSAGSSSFDTSGLVQDAVNWYFSTTGDDRAKYDSDGDKVMDGVMLIYAAPDYVTLKQDQYTNLWAYCFWIQPESTPLGVYPNVFFWASYDFIYGGNTAPTRTGSSYYNGDTMHCNLDAHTYIHEMGHVFGLEDYYDYSSYGYFPAGAFSMQDYNVGGHDPYSVFALGWASAYIPEDTATITISSFQENHDLILLSPHFNEYFSPFDEYILLELYTPSGLNEKDSTYKYQGRIIGPKTSGIRVWHVDSRLATPTTSFGDRFRMAGTNAKQTTSFGITHAFSNTYDDGDEYTQDYLSVMGSGNYDYNILQLIRNDKYATYHPNDYIVAGDLFGAGDLFTMETYSKQFVKGSSLNSGESLGWTFTVDEIANGTATITVTRL